MGVYIREIQVGDGYTVLGEKVDVPMLDTEKIRKVAPRPGGGYVVIVSGSDGDLVEAF